MSFVTPLQDCLAEVFDTLKTEFLPVGVRCFLLKRDGMTQRFTPISEITTGFFVEYSEMREQFLFEIATSTAGFNDTFAQATHIGYGVPASSQVEVFEIPLERDKIAPAGTSPLWKAYCDKLPNERYTIV